MKKTLASLFFAMAISAPALAQVSDGQPVNAATTNGAFLYKNSDTAALGKLSVNNAADPTVSGPSITNIQRELNSLSSFTGKPTNQVYNYTPNWTHNDVGTSADSVKTRADDITALFNGTTGHAHTGSPGDGAQISYTSLIGNPSFSDATFSIFNASDNTKLMAMDVSGVSASTTRTLKMADANVDLANLTNSNISASAAIAYSKLNLTGDIVNADISAAAAIARSKIAVGTANHVVINDGSGNLSSEATLATSRGGTNISSYATGATLYSSATNVLSVLAGNITTTKKFLTQTGTGAASQAPGWNTISGSDLPNPSASTLGGIESYAAVSHQWINTISTSGVPSSSQPSFTDISGTATVGQGGTGQTSYTDGQVLIGNTSGNTLAKSTLTPGANITITNGGGSITIAASSSAAAAFHYTSQTTTYSAAINDYVVASGASFAITLPTAVGQSGMLIAIQHNGTSLTQAYTLNTTSSQTINGPGGTVSSGNYILQTNGEVVLLLSDGANWQVTQHKTDTGWTNAGALTVTGSTTNPIKGSNTEQFQYRRQGSNAEFYYAYIQTAGGAGAGSGAYIYALPFTMAATVTTWSTGSSVTDIRALPIGDGLLSDAASGAGNPSAFAHALAYDSTHFVISYVSTASAADGKVLKLSGGTASGIINNNFPYTDTNISIMLHGFVPISGWQP